MFGEDSGHGVQVLYLCICRIVAGDAMHVHIDETRGNDSTLRVDAPAFGGGRYLACRADRSNGAALNENRTVSDHARRRIYCAVFDQ